MKKFISTIVFMFAIALLIVPYANASYPQQGLTKSGVVYYADTCNYVSGGDSTTKTALIDITALNAGQPLSEFEIEYTRYMFGTPATYRTPRGPVNGTDSSCARIILWFGDYVDGVFTKIDSLVLAAGTERTLWSAAPLYAKVNYYTAAGLPTTRAYNSGGVVDSIAIPPRSFTSSLSSATVVVPHIPVRASVTWVKAQYGTSALTNAGGGAYVQLKFKKLVRIN